MTSLTPIKTPLSALAQKSVSQPRTVDGSARPQTARGGQASGADDASPRFDALNLRRVSSRAVQQASPRVPDAAAPAPRTTANAPTGRLSDQPQVFTLQTLSAVAGVLVAALEGESAPSGSNLLQNEVLSTDEPQSRGTGRAQPIGSRLNLSV